MSEDTPKELLVPEVIENEMRLILGPIADTVSDAMKKGVRELNNESMVENVAIFVDYDNVYWTLMKMFNHDPDHTDPERNLFEQIWRRYPRDKVRSFRVYADFERIPTNLTSLQRKRIQIRHVYSNDRTGELRKNASDIEMCIDAIESTYKDPNIGCYVFVTADSDVIPVLSRMMYKGKRVELLYLSSAAPKTIDITSYAHDSADLLDVLNIEQKEYQISSYVANAVQIIENWHRSHGGNRSKWLGAGWLKDQFQTLLSLPGDTASQLLELLEVERYVETEVRQTTNNGEKRSYRLTLKGSSIVSSGIEEAAPSTSNLD